MSKFTAVWEISVVGRSPKNDIISYSFRFVNWLIKYFSLGRYSLMK